MGCQLQCILLLLVPPQNLSIQRNLSNEYNMLSIQPPPPPLWKSEYIPFPILLPHSLKQKVDGEEKNSFRLQGAK